MIIQSRLQIFFVFAIVSVLLSAGKKPVAYDKCFFIFGIRKDGYGNPGSGFFVKGKTGYYLVTAKHVLIEKAHENDTAVSFNWPTAENARAKIQVRNMHNQTLFTQELLTPSGRDLMFHFHYDSVVDGVPDIGVLKFKNPSREITEHCYQLSDLSDETSIVKKVKAYGIGYPGRKIKIDSAERKTLITVDTLGMRIYSRQDKYKSILFTFDHAQEGTGMSGGPIINAKSKKIVGVIAGDSVGTYAFYAKQIINWLEKPSEQ